MPTAKKSRTRPTPKKIEPPKRKPVKKARMQPQPVKLAQPSPKMSPELARAIEVWPIEKLKPYARNARTHSKDQVAKIAASITEFGFNNPILVDGKNGVIAG